VDRELTTKGEKLCISHAVEDEGAGKRGEPEHQSGDLGLGVLGPFIGCGEHGSKEYGREAVRVHGCVCVCGGGGAKVCGRG
jgi:hypothetical protein